MIGSLFGAVFSLIFSGLTETDMASLEARDHWSSSLSCHERWSHSNSMGVKNSYSTNVDSSVQKVLTGRNDSG